MQKFLLALGTRLHGLPSSAFSLLGFLPLAAAPTAGTIDSFFNALSNDVFGFMLAASVFCLAFAAFLYMFAGENERRIQAAKTWLFAAGIGLAVALLAPTIAGLIQTATGGKAGQ